MALTHKKHPIVIDVHLAAVIGLTESVVLQQIIYWVTKSKEAGRNFEDGRYWTYNTAEEWQKQLPCFSTSTIRRTLEKLEDLGLILTGNYNKQKFDRTKWYTTNDTYLSYVEQLIDNNICNIDLLKLDNSIYSNWVNATTQNEQPQLLILSNTIPETNLEINSETNTRSEEMRFNVTSDESPVPCPGNSAPEDDEELNKSELSSESENGTFEHPKSPYSLPARLSALLGARASPVVDEMWLRNKLHEFGAVVLDSAIRAAEQSPAELDDPKAYIGKTCRNIRDGTSGARRGQHASRRTGYGL